MNNLSVFTKLSNTNTFFLSSTTTTMASASQIFMTVFTLIQAGIGITLNTCVLAFSFESLKKQLSLNPTNVIYFTMGLVNLFMQAINMAQNFFFCFWTHLFFTREINVTFTCLLFSLIYCNYWLTGWLCAYYCININNFTHQTIVGLKRVLSAFLPHILLISAIGSLILSVLSIWLVDVTLLGQTSTNSTQDLSVNTANFIMPLGYRLIGAFLGCFLPFVLAIISTGVTASSLIKHIIKMKQNISDHSCPNPQVLIRATRTMVLFLIFSVMFIIAELLSFTSSKYSFSDVIPIISWILITSLPSAQGAIIVQAIPSLRKMILEKLFSKRQSSNVID